jgi:hypothetical protein
LKQRSVNPSSFLYGGMLVLLAIMTTMKGVYAQIPTTPPQPPTMPPTNQTTLATNATAINATNATATTTNTTNSSSMELQGVLAPDRIEALSAQDPEFRAWQEMYDMCQGYNLPLEEMHRNNVTISYDQCMRSMQQSVDKWCNLATYEKDKCETAGHQLSTFIAFNEIKTILGLPDE